jgi:hypothetical protein
MQRNGKRVLATFCFLLFIPFLTWCKPTANSSTPNYYYVNQALNSQFESRRETCEVDSNHVWQNETCVDIQDAEQQCNSQKTTTWDSTTNQCVTDPAAADRLRNSACVAKGGTYSNGLCSVQ